MVFNVYQEEKYEILVVPFRLQNKNYVRYFSMMLSKETQSDCIDVGKKYRINRKDNTKIQIEVYLCLVVKDIHSGVRIILTKLYFHNNDNWYTL